MDSTTAEEGARPEKRQRLEEQVVDGTSVPGGGPEHADGVQGPPPADQLRQALQKIANHISNSAKFPKASQLLRQVMDAVDKSHSDNFFAAIKAAFTHPEHCIDPLLRKDYMRLIKAVNLRSEVLSKQQRARLEVYSILAVTQNELFTDDSFVFNKVIAKIKTAISELPDADEEQEAAWVELFPQQAAALGITAPKPMPTAATAAGSAPAAGSSRRSRKQEVQEPAAEDVEADPFGLDAFIAKAEADAAAEAAAAAKAAAAAATETAEAGEADATDAGLSTSTEPQATGSAVDAAAACGSSAAGGAASGGGAEVKPKLTWCPVSCLVMKKQALLSCIETAKAHQHKFAWARTSIEILIEEVTKPAAQGGFVGKFVGGQKQQLQELLKFVHSERAARKSGVNRRPGGKGTGEYMTTFEKTRAEWGSASWVSARGKIGGQGDAKQANWLG